MSPAPGKAYAQPDQVKGRWERAQGLGFWTFEWFEQL